MKLSIIIPVYNVEKYIVDSVSSIYRQGLKDDEFEIILVNDGSTDKSIEVVQNFIYEHKNIQIIHQHNQGMSAARNNGITHANGEYIYFMDSDDVLFDNSLNLLLLQITESKADTIEGKYIKKEDKDLEEKNYIFDNKDNEVITMSGKERFTNDNVYDCSVWKNIYRKDFLVSCGLKFIPGINHCEDVAFYSEMMVKAKKYSVSNITHYIYRQRGGSTISTMNKQKLIHANIAGEYIWHNCQKAIIHDKACYNALVNRIFQCAIAGNIWYITHYYNIFPYRQEILDDIKKRIPLDIFTITLKQRLLILALKIFPNIFLLTRYKLCKKY